MAVVIKPEVMLYRKTQLTNKAAVSVLKYGENSSLLATTMFIMLFIPRTSGLSTDRANIVDS